MSLDHLNLLKTLRNNDSMEPDSKLGSSKHEPFDISKGILNISKCSKLSSKKCEMFQDNAYRVLGQSINASQADIHEANSSMRRCHKIGVDITTSWDLPWLGPFTRTEKDLQAAIGKLTNPAQRLKERLFWFSENAGLLNAASIESLPSIITELERETSNHDLAILKFTYANLTDPEINNKNLWVETINSWQNVIDLDDYWVSLLDIEIDGQFEPFATIEDVENLKRDVNRLLCSELLALANECVITNNDNICRQVFSIFRDSKLPRNTFYDFETQVLGGLEDEFNQSCEQIRNDLSSAINREDTNTPDNINACTAALNRFDNEIQPFLNRLLNLSGQNTELANRAKEEAATCLRSIAINFTWADEFIHCQKLLERARSIAPKSTSIYHRILEDLGGVEEASEKQKIWKDSQPIKSAPLLQTINGVGFTLYGCTDIDSETNSYLATYYFVFFFIPIFPICRYRVISSGDNSYKFLGKASLSSSHKWHIGISLFLILIAFLWVSASSSNYSSTINTSSTPTEEYTAPDSPPPSTNELTITQEAQNLPESITPSNPNDFVYKNELKSKLESGREKITSLETSYNQLADEVKGLKLELDQKQSELQTLQVQATNDVSIEEYETERHAYNELVEKHNQTLLKARNIGQEYKALLEEDRKMVQEYNSL
jgi:hypothetical protein